MGTESDIYVDCKPGDLITCEIWKELQTKIKGDIGCQIDGAIENIDRVNNAGNTEKLDGKTVKELTAEILEKALKAIPSRTGYMKIFKQLKVGKEEVIKHNLKACPLVDVYQLEYFKAVCAIDKDVFKSCVNFYLYHSNEKKIRCKDEGGNTVTIEIEPNDSQPYKVPFYEMLERYNVEYTENSSLGDLETEFWKAFFADPNDNFDSEQYCHSPWYERCCREERTVESLKKKGDWDDLWFKFIPRKTINYLYPAFIVSDVGNPLPAPTQIQVIHFDFDTIGIKLLANPFYDKCEPDPGGEMRASDSDKKELKVMLLLKV